MIRRAATVPGAAVLAIAGFAAVSAPVAARESPGGPAAQQATNGSYDESVLLSRIRQLTFDGPRAGEGYFSPDGSHIVFQSERQAGNPFYQIYDLDLETGDTIRVSPGQGKTTCPFFQSGSGAIIFASTHLDPRSADLQRAELEFRASGQERRYAWDYDPEMDIFLAPGAAVAAAGPDGAVDASSLVRLTDARGYDAEGSVSPDGRWIVFSSTRGAYGRELDEGERRQLEIDPSYFAEIYIMRADGSEQRRLTNVAGYDGGPFFFPDGSRIVWRRFTEDGLLADVWSMKPDGSDQRRITDFDAMSWAPYVHPSGEYILFASNKLGFTNFEIYMVDVEGTKQPVRVTTTDGFDGLPVPTPDGEGLAWTSSRNSDGGQGAGQLFIADWNHAKALELLAAAPVRQAGARAIVERLASDELGGRLTGTEGADKAADYIAARLRELGAEPLPGRDAFKVSFEFTAGVTDTGSRLVVRDSGASSTQEPLVATAARGDVRGLSFSDDATVEGGLVFAGYGITLPESEGYPYDSYAELDVAGKIVIILRDFPQDVDQEARVLLARFSQLRYKAMRARELGAAGLLVVIGPRSPGAGALVDMSFDSAVAGSGIAAASISGATADALLARVPGKELETIQAELDTGNPHVAGFALDGLQATLGVDVERQHRTGYNVVGYLPASEAVATGLERPWVMLGAHYDHLGRGGGGNSLARGNEVGEIHNGADDNASGVAAVLEAGARLASLQHRRGIVLAFWSGEELGLLGSNAFVEGQTLPLDQLAAYINFDMVGRARDNVLTLQAVGSSDVWPGLIERTNVPIGFDVRIQEDPWLPTDSSAFNAAGVPTLSFFTGSHEQYHRPTDDAVLINYDDLERIARFGALLARRVANLGEAPAFVAVARGSEQGGSREAVRIFTGTIPDYASDAEGLLLGGVIEGGPAEEAGLQGGDLVVELAGQSITNIYDYMYVLEALEVDVPVKVVYVRAGERHEAQLTPRARQ